MGGKRGPVWNTCTHDITIKQFETLTFLLKAHKWHYNTLKDINVFHHEKIIFIYKAFTIQNMKKYIFPDYKIKQMASFIG